jgi:hypothetical protein
MANRNIAVRLQVEGGRFKADLLEAGQVGQNALKGIGDAAQTAAAGVQQVTRGVGGLDAEAAKAARSAERLKRTYQDGYAAAQEQAKATDLLSRGALNQAEFSSVIEGIGRRYTVANNNARQFGAALEVQSRQARVTSQQFAQLQPQLNDIFTSITTGASPLTVALQQGPQITQIFGGLGNTLRAIGPTALAAAAGFAAIAVPIGIVLARAVDLDRQSRTFTVALAAMGRAGQTTADDLGKLVDRLRDVGVARDEARGAVSALVRTPGLGTGQIDRLASLSPDLAAATGGSATDAAKQLADAATGGYDAIIKLDRALGGFLAPSQRTQIRLLSEQGEKTRAFAIAIDALEGRIKGLNEQSLSPTAKTLNEIGRAWDRLVDNLARGAVGRITLDVVRGGLDLLGGAVGPSAAPRSPLDVSGDALGVARDRLARLNAETARYRSQDAEVTIPGFGFGSPNALRADLQRQIDALEGQVRELAATGPSADREGARGRAFAGLPPTEIGSRIGDATATQVSDLARRSRVYNAAPSQRAAIEAEIAAETEARERGLNTLEKEALVRARVADAVAQQRQQISDQTREVTIQTARTLDLAAAYAKGQGEVQRAEAARQAGLESLRTGVNAAVRAEEILSERVAETAVAQARAANDAAQAADSARRLAEAELQGADAVRQAEIAERALVATREARATLTNASGEAEKRLKDAIEATTTAIQNQAEAERLRSLARAQRSAESDAEIARMEAEAAAINDPAKRRAAELEIERERRLRAQREQFGGVDPKITAAQDVAAAAREQARLISETRAKAQELASDISGFLVDGFVNAGQGGRSAFKNLADGAVGLFKRAAARIAATLLEQQFILPITTQIVGSAPGLFGVSGGGGGGILGSIFGSIFGGGGGGGATSSFAGDAAASSFFGGFTPVAKGGVFNAGNITPFARGGIVNRPTMFPLANGGTGLMGEAGAEAVVPLARDRLGRLGVRNDGGGGGDGTVVQIYDMRSAGNSEPVRTQERRGPDGRREIAVMIEEKIEDSVRSGRMDQPFAQTFGSRRVTKRV